MSGADATFLASTLVLVDEVVFFEFRAADDAAVLELAGRAGIAEPAIKVWRATP